MLQEAGETEGLEEAVTGIMREGNEQKASGSRDQAIFIEDQKENNVKKWGVRDQSASYVEDAWACGTHGD